MSVTVKLFTQILNELVGWVQTHTAEIDDFNDGSIAKTLLEALAFELDFSNLQIENAQAASAIDLASGIDLDLKVGDYGITRKPALPSSGTMQFTLAAPAPFGGFVIPANTVVSTPARFNPYDAIEFTTDADLVIAQGQTVGTTAATAVVPGAASNQSVGAVTVLVNTIAGVQGVTNTSAFTGGTDEESDASLRVRGKAAFTSVANDLASSFQAVVLAVEGVLSVAVAGFGDPLMTRDNGQGGKVDVYFQAGQNLQTAVETYVFNTLINGGNYFFSPYIYAPPSFNVLRNVPVTQILQVKNVTTSAIIPSSQYSLVLDSSFFGDTDRAADALQWSSTAGITNGDVLEVTFKYDAMLAATRKAAETKRGVSVDLVTKKGVAVPVNATMTVNAKPGFNLVQLQSDLNALVSTYLASRLLNQDVLQSQLILLVGKFNGVQNVQLPLDLLSTTMSGVSDIIVDEAHYIVPGIVNILVKPPLDIQ
jgi:uncharacterized phage protein gp47/JayE